MTQSLMENFVGNCSDYFNSGPRLGAEYCDEHYYYYQYHAST